jgi:hypothetical protein
MRLNDVIIQTVQDITKNFSFEEIWRKKILFFLDCDPEKIGYTPKESAAFLLVKYCFSHYENTNSIKIIIDNKLPYKIEGQFEGQSESKIITFEYLRKDQIQRLIDLFKTNDRLCNSMNLCYGILVLHEFARQTEINFDKVIDCLRPLSFTDEDIIKSDEIKLTNNDALYLIKQYDFIKGEEEYEIRTKKITNITNNGTGLVKIAIVGRNDSILKTMILKVGESIFGNFIDAKIVEFLPAMSIRKNYCIFLTKDSNNNLILSSYDGNNKHEYKADESKGVTQFTATDDEGFVSIINRKLVNSSNIQFKFNTTNVPVEFPVKVVTRGDLFVILTNKGHTYSNCNFNHHGLISVAFNDKYIAYGITNTGKVMCNNQSIQIDSNYKDIVSIYALGDKILMKNISGTLYSDYMDKIKAFPCVNDIKIHGENIYILDDKNELSKIDENNKTKKIKDQVIEFDLDGNNMIIKSTITLHVYDVVSETEININN